ncbi:MAG: hypothetical protein JJU29_15995 [Verrucomicrobia bacterium]|nr:hypothetical protein [Verrucomicrobiota bacterium]MCH8512923.1 hypothetical protein [Kiritimatiellia bacterium]
MKKILIPALLMITTLALAEPMTASVSTWEGDFTLKSENTPIRIKGLPMLLLWEYELKSGSRGTSIGFSSADGGMITAPRPNNKGVQPIYTGHIVSMRDDETADILVTYSVQGNGGWKVVERYVYDGVSISLISVSRNGGKPDFEWFSEPIGKHPSP